MKMRLLLISLLVCFQGVHAQGLGQGNQYDPMDGDKDGWNDLWVYMFDYAGRSRGHDSDGDGVTDYKEMQRFTNPYIFNAELPPITMQSHAEGGASEDIHISFPIIPRQDYAWQLSTAPPPTPAREAPGNQSWKSNFLAIPGKFF